MTGASPSAYPPKGRGATGSAIGRLSPGLILGYDLGVFILLVALLLGRPFHWLGVDRLPALIGGVVPLVVPWGGALGGLCISLVGLAAYWQKYELDRADEGQKWNAWHLVRPVLGAAFGTFAALIVVLIVGTMGVDANGRLDVTPTGAATLMVIAFVVGYRQQVFAQLVTRVVDTILGPGQQEPEPPEASFEVSPSPLDFGQTAVNTHSERELTIVNKGTSKLTVSSVVVAGDGFARLHRLPDVEVDKPETLAIRFSPTAQGTVKGSAKITAGGKSRTVELIGTGT